MPACLRARVARRVTEAAACAPQVTWRDEQEASLAAQLSALRADHSAATAARDADHAAQLDAVRRAMTPGYSIDRRLTDADAIRLAVKTVVRVRPEDTKIVRIPTTLEIMDIHVSEPMLPFIKANPSMFEVVGEPEPFKFDAKGTLYPMLGRHHEHATA